MAVACLSLASAFVVGFIASWVSSSFSFNVREKIFNHVARFSPKEVNKFSVPSLITRTTQDVVQVRMLIAFGLAILVKAPIMAVWAITKISGRGWEWTAATGIAVAVMLAAMITIAIVVLPKFKKMQIQTDNLTKVARENLTGLAVVHAYNAAPFQQKKFDDANHELTHTQLFTGIWFSFLNPIMTLVISGMSLSIYLIGAILINSAGDLGAKAGYSESMLTFMQYAMQVIMSFMMIVMMFVLIPRAAVSAKRINEVLRTEISIKGGETESAEAEKFIEFKNVSFKYPNAAECVAEGIDFFVKRGETVAIIGGTGSGKSTVVNLLPRFYDATGGQILISGVDIREYDLKKLREIVGFVSQKAVIFNGTVRENVAYGAQIIDDERVRKALSISQGLDFVEKMGGIETEISRGGQNLSGGQKQRISIARAVYKNPEIIVFDDSFSALDFKTDRDLRHALKAELHGATQFIVSQRIGTIMDADKILVMENGRIVGAGKHADLLKSCRVYREIAESQLEIKGGKR
jgi:ATP-binding cassette subfamily B protein